NNGNGTSAGANPSTSNPAEKSNIVPAPPDTSPTLSAVAEPNPGADILLPENFPQVEILRANSQTGKPVYTTGVFSEIADKRKVFVNVISDIAGGVITNRLKAYSKLEIVKTAGEAEFVVHYYYWADHQPESINGSGLSN